jgi:hypothetical protein
VAQLKDVAESPAVEPREVAGQVEVVVELFLPKLHVQR